MAACSVESGWWACRVLFWGGGGMQVHSQGGWGGEVVCAGEWT